MTFITAPMSVAAMVLADLGVELGVCDLLEESGQSGHWGDAPTRSPTCGLVAFLDLVLMLLVKPCMLKRPAMASDEEAC